MLERWLEHAGTDPTLQDCIVEYCRGRGGISMDTIMQGKEQWFRQMAADQDRIRWRQFLEGMICKKARNIQTAHYTICGARTNPQQWVVGTIIKLLEATH
jgi:hypothetical protein